MAQNISFPEIVSFSKNPIIVSFQTSTAYKAFLKAVLEASVYTIKPTGSIGIKHSAKYSIPLEFIANEKVDFDLSSLTEIVTSGYDKDPNLFLGFILKDKIRIDIMVYEEYFLNGEIIRIPNPELEDEFPDSNLRKALNVVSGGLTDYERMVYFSNNANTIEKLIGDCKILSRKPKGELIHPDSIITVPAITNHDGPITAAVIINKTIVYGEEQKNIDAYRCFLFRRSVSDIISQYPEATMISVSIAGKSTPIGYIGKKRGRAYHFSFKNGFGMIENITCYSREKLAIEMKATESSSIPSRQKGDVINFFTKKGNISINYTLSTGIINKEWCEWFVDEFFASDEHYLLIEGNWIPVSVIPDNEITLYDENKPAPISIDFTVKPRFNGFINDKFVQ